MKHGKTVRLFEGLPVVDATTSIKLDIQPLDVKHAEKNDPGHCAAALAGKRELKKDVRVFLTRTYVKEKKHWVRFMTPERTSREIIAFDRGSAFVPGTYTFDRPSPGQALGVHRGKSTSNGNGKQRQIHRATAHVREWRDRK